MTEKYKLDDICDFVNGGAWSDKEYTHEGIPVLKVSNFKPNGFEIENPSYLSVDALKTYEKNLLTVNDLVIATVGSHPNLTNSAAGRSCIIPESISGFLLNQNAVCVKSKDEDVLCQKYLCYLGQTHEFKHYIQSRGKGAANQMRIAIGAIKDYEVILPSILTQRRIAEILSAYDDLIENNQKQIKLLEEAAILLYKEWFVKLRFPGHENTKIVDGLPEGWCPGILEDAIEFDPKVKLDKDKLKKSIPMAALNTSSMILDEGQFTETYLNAGSKFQNGDTLLARITPCLENGKTAFVSGLQDLDGAVGSTEYIVMRSKRLNPYMVYCVARSNSFRQIAINSMAGADGRQRVQADKLKSTPCLIPPSYLVDLCGNRLQPVFQRISSLNQQCLQLKIARDKLLPKLMNGEIEVL